MPKRRPLIAGLKSKADAGKEQAFVYGRKHSEPEPPKKPRPKAAPTEPATPPEAAKDVPAEPPATPPVGRSPLTTRLRSDIATALKRASLERELAGQSPHTVQDIIEVVLEPWLKNHGYLK